MLLLHPQVPAQPAAQAEARLQGEEGLRAPPNHQPPQVLASAPSLHPRGDQLPSRARAPAEGHLQETRRKEPHPEAAGRLRAERTPSAVRGHDGV